MCRGSIIRELDGGTREDEVLETADIAASYKITRKIASSNSKQVVMKRNK